jgi:uncharacterized protein YoxC
MWTLRTAMQTEQESNSINLTEYRAQTNALVEAMNETTALCDDLADTMADLSTASTAFGQSTERLGAPASQARGSNQRQQLATDGGQTTTRSKDD